MPGDTITLIDAQADVEGKLAGKDARILGRFRGEIELTGRLLMGEGSHVEAKVRADAAEVAGEFKGELTARSLLLLEQARVEGSLDARTLAVREGAHMTAAVNVGEAQKGKPPAGASQPSTAGAAG